MAKSIKVTADALSAEISAIFKEYGDETMEALSANIKEVISEALPKIKADSPKRPSAGAKYSKGWRKRTTRTGRYVLEGRIYNEKKYQLTHLLEHGHEIVTADGVHHGRTRAIPHIEPVQEWAGDEVYKRTIDWFK